MDLLTFFFCSEKERKTGIVHLTVSGLLMIILPFVQGRRLAPAGGRRPEAGAKRAPAHLPLL